MTREEAVEILQESLRQNKVMQESPNDFFSSAYISDGLKNTKRRIAALDMAIAALRAQQTPAKLDRSRWKGCRTCNCQNSVFRNWGSYCPSCGLPFTEEAWAELERRVNGGTADN